MDDDQLSEAEVLTLDLLCISGARVVRIDLLRRYALIERDEPVEEVITRGVIVVSTRIVREVVAER